MNTLLICQVHDAHIKLQSKPREIPSLPAEQGHLIVTKQNTSLKSHTPGKPREEEFKHRTAVLIQNTAKSNDGILLVSWIWRTQHQA